MYSIVMMAAMTTGGTEAPGCHFKHFHSWGCSCYGCSCYGVSCYGCGACYGCWGCGGCYGCVGCYGSTMCFGCVGCIGCGGYIGGTYLEGLPVIGTDSSAPIEKPTEKGKEKEKEKMNKEDEEEQSARVLLDMPRGARLYVDGQLIKGTASQREFYTPRLRSGQAYFYDMIVETTEDGVTYQESKKVIVRSGQTIRQAFNGTERIVKPTPKPRQVVPVAVR